MADGCEELKKLRIPYIPGREDEGDHYDVNTREEKVISEYTGFTFHELEDLDAFTYWLYLHDAVIYNHGQTESGRQYLEECWIMEQTKPDREALRRKFKGGENNG